MREESQLEDIRSAIRGDFARLAQRRGEQELMRVEPDAEPAPVEPAPVESVVDPVDGARPRARSWLARFVSP